jgi:ubiquinone/menaquinone biosynthesis C-methylase UbiE
VDTQCTNDLVVYWNAVSNTKVFASPVRHDEIATRAKFDEPILDVGCGYGRVLRSLWDGGFRHLSGTDFAEKMVARARESLPREIQLKIADSEQLSFPDESFRAVILYAVLTCIVDPRVEEGLLGEIHRVLKPGGWVFINDNMIDPARTTPYSMRQDRHGTYGVFTVDDLAQVKHNSDERLRSLLSSFSIETFEHRAWTAMNGEPANGVCAIAQKALSAAHY